MVLETPLPFPKVRWSVELVVEGRQYEKNWPYFWAVCFTRETWARPRLSNPAKPLKRPSLSWPQPNMKLSFTSDVMVSLSLLKYPVVNEPLPYFARYMHFLEVEHCCDLPTLFKKKKKSWRYSTKLTNLQLLKKSLCESIPNLWIIYIYIYYNFYNGGTTA